VDFARTKIEGDAFESTDSAKGFGDLGKLEEVQSKKDLNR
jgi:hypothetical protein